MQLHHAYWNSSKICWEVLVQEPRGDRLALTLRHANIAKDRLRDQGVKYIDAHVSVYNQRHLLMIADPVWWLDNELEIMLWAKESNINLTLTGMIMEFSTAEEKMLFIMRW